MTLVGRSKIDHPALGTAGGSALHASIETIYTNVGNHLSGRYLTATGIANSAVTTFDHNFGVPFADLQVLIYTGTYPALTRVADPAGSGWTIAATAGFLQEKVDVTAPSSGGPHAFSVLISEKVSASATQGGIVNTTTQTFAGVKTWNDIQTFKAAAGTVTAFTYDSTGAATLGPSAGFGTALGQKIFGPIVGAISSSIEQMSFAGGDRAFIGNNIYLDSAAAAKRSIKNSAGYSYIQLDRSATAGDTAFQVVSNTDTQSNGAAGTSVTTNEKTLGFVTHAGAWTSGPAVTNNGNGQAHIFHGGINAGGTGTGANERRLNLNANTYSANSDHRARVSGVAGSMISLYTPSSDTDPCIYFDSNLAADSTTTGSTTKGTMTPQGAWTLGAVGTAASIGMGVAPVAGYNLAIQGTTSDDTLNRFTKYNAGGGSTHTDFCSQTTTGITTAKAIAGLEAPSLVMVRGSDGSGNEFFDLLISNNSGTHTLISSATVAGSPAGRTYSIASFNLQVAMASGTYTTNVSWFQIFAR